MGIKDWAGEKLSQALAGSQLTLRGELVVMREDMSTLASVEYAALDLKKEFAALRKLAPGIKIEEMPGVCDVTVKLLAYETGVNSGDYYEQMRNILVACARKTQEAGLRLRLDVLGTLATGGEEEQFRFLNRGDEVAWKITARQATKGPLGALRRRFWGTKAREQASVYRAGEEEG